MRRRSNRRDVYADLLRDVSRRDKLRRFLTQDEPGVDEDTTSEMDASAATDTSEVSAFRRHMGRVLRLAEAAGLMPSSSDVPYAHPVIFADRLGFFLADGAEHASGAFPEPDDHRVTVYPVAFLESADGVRFRVHARSQYYGEPRYSFVQSVDQGTGEEWFGRVWLLFSCVFDHVNYELALVSWLTERASTPFNTTKRTFCWTSRHVDCIEVRHFTRVVAMARCFATRGSKSLGPVFHLLDE